MVVYYSREQLHAIWNSEAFNEEYEKYKVANKSKIDKLLNINKKDFQLSELSDELKTFKNNLNKLSTSNIKKMKSEIINIVTDDILEECIIIIIDKCISEPSYIDLYIVVLKNILDKNVLDIRYIINDKIKTIFATIIEDDELSEYDKLCNINKRLDNSVGLCILIVKLEQNFIIENYIKNTIDRFLSTLDISNAELCDKSITSLYTIFTLLDPRFIIVYEDKLQEIKNQDIGKKNKFKIMDIFDLKK